MKNEGLSILNELTGRALYVEPDGTLYVSNNYTICRSRDKGDSWDEVTTIPCRLSRRWVPMSRLACRLLRYEVRAMTRLSDGQIVAANREGVYFASEGQRQMCPSAIDDNSVPPRPPMSFCRGPEDRILWSEYFGNPERREMRVFVSDDGGKTFDVGYVFSAGEIRHVHNIIYDAKLGQYWILAGDFENEAGFALLSGDLSRLEWVARGGQQVRGTNAFDFGDHFVYGTDTEKDRNAIMRLDKSTGAVERMQELEGSCIYSCRFGDTYCLTTTVEPSQVNLGTEAQMWVSRDGERWTKVFEATRDRWCGKYFQYGSLVLPRCPGSDSDTILFSAQSLKGIDDKAFVATVNLK